MTNGHHQMHVSLASLAKRWSTGQVPCQLSTGGGLHTCCRWINRNCTTVPQSYFKVLSLTALSYCVSGYNSSWCVRQVAPYGFMQNQGRAPHTEQFLLLICSPLRKSSSSRFNSRPSGQFTPLPLLLVSLTIAHDIDKQD